MKNNQKGRSMIEMLGVLAIIGVLSVGGIAGYSKAMAKFRSNKMMDQVSHMVANIRILFGSQKSYDALKGNGADVTKLLVDARLVPDDLKSGTDSDIVSLAMAEKTAGNAKSPFTNPYGGNVVIKSSGLTQSGDDRAFTIVYTDIPKEACIDLAAQDWNSSSGSGLIAFGINKDPTDYFYGACKSDSAVTAATATTAAQAVICAQDLPVKVGIALGVCANTVNNFYFKFH